MPRKEQRGGLGRRLAIGIYAVVLAYLVIVGFASVIPQVFWPAGDGSFDLDCQDGLLLLRKEIDELRLAYLATNETDASKLRVALKPWDLRLNALAERCDGEQVHLLNQYRYRIELGIEKHMRDEAPLADRVTEVLGSPPDIPSTETLEPTP